MLLVHVVLVVPVVWLWLAAASPGLGSSPDANIGAGLVGLYLLAFGLPGSLVALQVDLGSLAAPVRDTLIAGLPLLNVSLHAALTWRLRRPYTRTGTVARSFRRSATSSGVPTIRGGAACPSVKMTSSGKPVGPAKSCMAN